MMFHLKGFRGEKTKTWIETRDNKIHSMAEKMALLDGMGLFVMVLDSKSLIN